MLLRNIEFKARAENLAGLEARLLELKPDYKGEDHQIDTYFKVPKGRLKLREGNIENALIYYERPDTADAKQSDIIIFKHNPESSLKTILSIVHGIKVVVEKTRKIYFIENVKFHFDKIGGLGTFIEVEAIDENGRYSVEKLKEQCNSYFSFFGLEKSNYINRSYSDMVLEKLNE